MIGLRTKRLVSIAAAALALSACDYECGTAAQTTATGTVRDAAGATLATATADVSDHVRPSYYKLSVGLMASANSLGAPLRGHVTRARLVTETGELIAEIPTGTSTLFRDAVVALNMDLPSEGEFNRVRTLLRSTRTKVILDTDLPGNERIETTLTAFQDLPANLGRCSFVT